MFWIAFAFVADGTQIPTVMLQNLMGNLYRKAEVIITAKCRLTHFSALGLEIF